MTSARVIYEAAQRSMGNFVKDFYNPNMRWLDEVYKQALLIFNEPSSPVVFLPRTPGIKRKCLNVVDKPNSLQQYESTFHDGTENKKLKIDDLSTIIDCSIQDMSANTSSRVLRARKKRVTSQPKKRSKRHVVISTQKTKSIASKQEFVPPFTETALQNKANRPAPHILTRNTLSCDTAEDVPNSCTPGLVDDTLEPEPVASIEHVCTSTPEARETRQVGQSTPLNTSCIPTEKDVAITEVAKTPINPMYGKGNVCEEVGRRDTWNVMHIQGGPAFGNGVPSHKKITKKNTDSPKQAETENPAVKKAAEFEKKDLLRQKAIEELQKKKQKQIEEKKKQREEREKEFAAKQQQLQEEEALRWKQLQLKEALMAKNQEEIRKAREFEEKKKREVRDVKTAELFARRQKEEEERRRKVEEQIRDENRKQDIHQRKYEVEEQKRLELIAEKDMLGKDKLRQLEEIRFMDEERKKREFMEKDKHRLGVEMKKKEEKEKEKLDRQAREEKNMQAEKEILDSKKREMAKAKEEERQRAKEKIRAEINYKFKNDHTNRVINVPQVLRASPRNVPQVLRSSPRLKVKYNPPVVPLVQRDSIYTSYDIDDLDSDDSTDDESQPAKRVPSWAVGARLKKQLTSQFFTNIDADDIFLNCMEPLRLDKIFNRNKSRYFKRTSSAQWGSPPMKAIHKYRK